MPYCVTGGVKTYYEVFGEGPPLVMLHCNPFDHWVFLYQIPHFSTYYKVIAPDLRGYGRTDKVTDPYTLADLEADVMGVIEQEGVTEAILMGVSIGAVLTLKLGHDHPDLFKALIAVGASSPAKDRGPNDPRVKGYREQGIEGYYRVHCEETVSEGFAGSPRGRALIDMFVERSPWLKAEGIVKLLQARAPENLLPLLPHIRPPMLVINGEFDTAFEGGKKTASLVPGALRKVLANTGHACCIEDPAGFDSLVLEFLDAHGLVPRQE
jgi:pimeloyl-ACP methyl ester carboxylesterase